MKPAAARVDEFVARPPADWRAVLLYGPDAGLVRERADRLTAAICPDLQDPFRITDLAAGALSGDPARLADEVAAMSLIGGRRVVRIRDAGDSLTAILAPVLAGSAGDSLIVAEAGDLPPRSSLRKLCEGAGNAAAIACYPDSPRDIATVIRETLAARRVTIGNDALAYLVSHLGVDRMVTRAELEKLALYIGDGGRVELDDAQNCIGDSTGLSVDEMVFAAAEGDLGKLDTLLRRCLEEGQSPISLLRAAMRHFHRLHLARGRMAAGANAEEAVRAIRPPIFFKLQDRFRSQLSRWPLRRLAGAIDSLTRAELDGKRAILPQDAVLREALLTIARAARRS